MSIKNNIETSIDFGGFYESIHDSNIDHMVEAYEYDFNHIDYKKTFESYIESYCGNIENYILDEYEVNINFEDLKLYIVSKKTDINNYEYDYAYDFDWDVSYNDFSVPKSGCRRKRSPSFMKTMFSHS